MEPVGLGGERGLAELDLVQSGLGQHPDLAVVIHSDVKNVVVAQPAFARVITETRRLDPWRRGRCVTGIGHFALEEGAARRAKPDSIRHDAPGGQLRPGHALPSFQDRLLA